MGQDLLKTNAGDLVATLPLLIVAATGLLAMIASSLSRRRRVDGPMLIGLGGLAMAGLWIGVNYANQSEAFGQVLIVDRFALFFQSVALVAAAIALLAAYRYASEQTVGGGDLVALALFSTCGMMVMAMAQDLVVGFIGLEVLSIPLYVLAGYSRRDRASNEAALKYLLLGAFASGFFLYGIALLYGALGTTNLRQMAGELAAGLAGSPSGVLGAISENWLVVAGASLVLVGVGFKAALVPFHMWTPDVYEGAPTPITAFLAAGPKAAAFALLIRIFAFGLPAMAPIWGGVLWVIAVLTMTLGNVVALRQTRIKRMLAYSSIAHAGYLLIPLVASSGGQVRGEASAMYYTLVYALMNIGAFTAVSLLTPQAEGDAPIDSLAGMGFRRPLVGLAMIGFMFSLAGIPPTAGFMGKFFIFRDAINAGFIGLAVIAVLNAVVSAYYYLRVLVVMYMRAPQMSAERPVSAPAAGASDEILQPLSWPVSLAAAVCFVGVLGLGILPDWFMARALEALK